MRNSVNVIWLLSMFVFSMLSAFAEDAFKKLPLTEHKLIKVSPGKFEASIRLEPGSMLQLQPFSLPAIPKFLDSRLKIKLTGDPVLEEVGQINTSVNEGRSGRSVFLYVREFGKTNIQLTLVDEDDREFNDYQANYSIIAPKPKQ